MFSIEDKSLPCLFPHFPYLCAAKSINKYHCGWRLNDLALYESIKNIQTQAAIADFSGGVICSQYATIKAEQRYTG